MKYSINHDFARILATMNLFEALGQNEFTGKQYDEMRTAKSHENAKGTCWAGRCEMRWVPTEFKPYSLKDMREDGFIIVARQEPIEIMVAVEIHRVLDRNHDEVFRGTWDECCEWVGDCRRNFQFRWAETEQRPMQAVRNYYTINHEAFLEYLAQKFNTALSAWCDET